MRRCALLLLCLPFAWTAGQTAPKEFDPLPRKEAILKLFVDEFIPITPGKDKYPASFSMGSTALAEEQPIRKVTLKEPFAMAKYEVTQELYQVVMGSNPAKWKGPRNSMEELTWHEAAEFCAKVTQELRQRKLIGPMESIRLPSEAEWEYVCRAGTDTAYSFGDDEKDLTMYCWYKKNAPGNDPPVGEKKANPWGFYDMHGYNWEWCLDDWAPNYEKASGDASPRKIEGEKEKVMRGGSWNDGPDQSRSAFRGHHASTGKHSAIGFRCVKVSR